ncbi:YchJ family protein [Flavobacterium ardleyense]|uniref:YchJ family protein n=1 Tax=Flavobacterium ardleyense TaxID=2038737 RepID=UPI00298CCD59|nr:YchJ family metal-binding protein [Flavobacterium ardleyense]
MTNCYCGSLVLFANCCQPLIIGTLNATSAEQLMRSRYSAYCTQEADYLVQTTHKSTRKLHKKSDILSWSKANRWLKLEIIEATTSTVEFKAYYSNGLLGDEVHHEKSTFIFEDGSWFYVDGIFF